MCEPKKRCYLPHDHPWREDLARLRGRGLSVRQIDRELARLYPELSFSKSSVWYWLNAEGREDADGDGRLPAWERRRLAREAYQASRGFPLAGLQLCRREVDVLALLRERGPLTGRKVARLLGVRALRCRSRFGWHKILPRLARWGLVVASKKCRGRGRPRLVYRLADWLLPRADPAWEHRREGSPRTGRVTS